MTMAVSASHAPIESAMTWLRLALATRVDATLALGGTALHVPHVPALSLVCQESEATTVKTSLQQAPS
jgi:hypothetical protein